MSRPFYPLIIVAASIGIVLASIVILDDFELKKALFFAGEEDKAPVEKLYRIAKATALIMKEFEKVESILLKSSANTVVATADQLRVITETTSDVDFIYADLDSIRGSADIKIKRKSMAEKLNALSIRIDTLLSFLGKER